MMQISTHEEIKQAMQTDPAFVLSFLVQVGFDEIYANLITENIYAAKTEEAVFNAIAKLLDQGEKAKVLRVLKVSEVSNVPEGYEEILEEMGYITRVERIEVPAGLETGMGGTMQTTNGDTTTTTGNQNQYIWEGLFGMTSDIVVGLWGNPQYQNGNPYYQQGSNNTIWWVVGGGVFFVILIVISIVIATKGN